MKLEWVIDNDKQLTCNESKTSSGKIKCELPWDHIVGGVSGPIVLDYHTGRNSVGAWLSWTTEDNECH